MQKNSFKNRLINSNWQRKAGTFLISQNVSLFGSSVVAYAVIWHITLRTTSGVWMMLATICSTLPQVFVSLFAGVWADRYNRKVLIMAADAGIALATLGLAIAFFAGFQNLVLLLAVSAVRSVGAGIQTPAVNAVYPQIVPKESLVKVQGINQTINSILLLLSPAVGGAMLGTLGIGWTFLVDVVTASAAIVIMSLISLEKISLNKKITSVFAELKEGIKYALGSKFLRQLFVFLVISFILITPAAVLSPLFIARVFGEEVWRLTANEIVWTSGSIIGGIFVAVKGKFNNKIKTTAICLVGFGLTFAVLGYTHYFWLFLVVMGISGLFMPALNTAQITLLQESVQEDMMGRVFSLVQIVTSIAMPVAILVFGPLADVMPMEIMFLVTGLLLAVSGVVCAAVVKQPPAIKKEVSLPVDTEPNEITEVGQ